MASDVYTRGKFELARGTLDWPADLFPLNVFRCLLVTPGYVYNAAHQFVPDVTAFEVSDASYARQDVLGRTAVLDLGGDRGLLDANDTLFPLLDVVSVGGAIIYKQLGGDDLTPDDDPLLCFVDIPDTVANGSNFLVAYAPDGVAALTFC